MYEKGRGSLGVREVVSSSLAVPTNKHGAFEEIRKPFFFDFAQLARGLYRYNTVKQRFIVPTCFQNCHHPATIDWEFLVHVRSVALAFRLENCCHHFLFLPPSPQALGREGRVIRPLPVLGKSLNGEIKVEDLVGGNGMQLRFTFQTRRGKGSALAEVHDKSDDVYYVLEGSAELTLAANLRIRKNQLRESEEAKK